VGSTRWKPCFGGYGEIDSNPIISFKKHRTYIINITPPFLWRKILILGKIFLSEEKTVLLLEIMQGECPMRRNDFIYLLIAIIVITVLFGCSPPELPETNDHVLIPKTITPVPSVISSSTAENVVLLQVFSGHSRRVLDVSFSAHGELLASSSQDMEIKLWDIQTGQEVHAFQMRSVDMADFDISISGNLLASGEAIWDLESKQEIHVLERGSRFPGSVAFSPDGSKLAIGLFEMQITLWDVISGQPVFAFDQQAENRTKRMEFSPDGALLAVGVYDGTVRLLDVASGEVVNTLAYSGETDIHGLAFSPDGKYLASGGRMLAVILWDVASGEVVRTFRLTDNSLSMAFSPDGTILATTGGSEYEVRLWDVESGILLHALPHDDQLMPIAFSPDGKHLAVGSFDGNIYLWGISKNPTAE
jgi:WD40 repeat protein